MAKRFTTPIEQRFSDLDAYGHVNSVIYYTYLETARVKLFKDFFQEMSSKGIFIVVGRSECDYRMPILLNDHIEVTVWVSRIGTTSFDLDYQVHDGEERVYATARTTMVCFDSIKHAPVAVPEQIRALAAPC